MRVIWLKGVTGVKSGFAMILSLAGSGLGSLWSENNIIKSVKPDYGSSKADWSTRGPILTCHCCHTIYDIHRVLDIIGYTEEIKINGKQPEKKILQPSYFKGNPRYMSFS